RLCTNQGCKSFVPSEKLDSQFLYWSLLFSVPKLQGLGSGATFAEISKSALEAFEISLPSLAEQKRIAAILDEQMAAVEKARAAAEAQLEAAKALPAAYLSQVFPKEGQELSPGWRWAKLGEICIGNGQYGLSEKASSVQQGLPILRMSNIRDGVIFWDDLKYVHLPGDLVHQYRLSKDDLLFNRTNSAELVGKSAVFDGNQEAVFASYLIRYRVRTNIVNPHFLCRYINSQNGRAFIEKNMTRAIGQVNINASTLAAMPIPLPNPDEQARFTAILNGQTESVDRLRNDIEKQLREINSLPAALLKRAFNGEL
ncbi:restriction endonuclease subunit S, partial [Candidatus Bathyarchaeota archaeon]|nr:restriction endonuclease subunit S [Candidatus Bathyarchaeota archaeon]